MKKVLVIHYSQTGQLTELLRSVTSPLETAGCQLTHLVVKPKVPYPFPWSRQDFFDTFPESVGRDPVQLEPMQVPPQQDHDLVILGYTIWYLNPSIPINSFLLLPEASRLLKGKPVVTVVGARNMWVLAQEYVQARIAHLGGRCMAHIAVEDRSPNLVSIITIIRWMFWGRKDPFLVFPRAGIRQEEMEGASRFGEVILRHMDKGDLDELNKELLTLGSMRIKPALLLLEKRATMIFHKYRAYILGRVEKDPDSRRRRVRVFSTVLPIGAFILSPITALAAFLLSRLKGRELRSEMARLTAYPRHPEKMD
ncbi:MAG: dialkylresorcinol condensing enzyme DarA [Flavobacteriales bacterium]|nr:dialkylresorcinol condensing enzyme DarA [Flavobacteriales bacterium]